MPSSFIRQNIDKIIAFTKDRKSNILLVKLAGIGDVAMTCKALNESLASIAGSIHFHWIIDKGLVELAKSLLTDHPKATYSYHPVDSSKLFNASKLTQANESLKIAKAVATIQPGIAILLHRDWRYMTLIRPFFTGSVVRITREPIHEIDAYKIAINRALSKIGVQSDLAIATPENASVRSSGKSRSKLKIGLLIGGAQGTKVTYQEKRWPYFSLLIHKLFSETKHELFFYGSDNDSTLLRIMLAQQSIDADSERIYDLTGKLSLDQLSESLSALDRFVSIDSGLGHIASLSMKKKGQRIISLFGPTNPKIWCPVGSRPSIVKIITKSVPCSPCYRDDGNFTPCKYTGEQFQYCMKLITVEEVFELLVSN